MEHEPNKKIALVIDAENTSVKYLAGILKELSEYGFVTYKRMYGDFTDDNLRGWNTQAMEHAIVPIQQPRYSKVKNAADIMMVIDAMDILYTGNVDGFCIVSSDSDFTRLVNRLREGGMMVIGMGKSDASKTLKAACTKYIILETIGENNEVIADSSAIVALSEIKHIIMEIVQQCEDRRERAGLGGVKSQIQRMHTDFDERNYGYSSMTTFVKDMKEFVVVSEKNAVYVERRSDQENRDEVESFIITSVRKKELGLSQLGQKVHSKFTDFDPRHFGYSQFARFVANIPGITIVEHSASKKSVVYEVTKESKEDQNDRQ
ncbi:MAG: NYN domain-containing protein [Lachnospiraceae bacterium]|nr:NYN domain-containing protein [Lachnospiraceae bacterium]